MNWSEKSSRNLNFFLKLATSWSLRLELLPEIPECPAGSWLELKPALVLEFSSW